jgi:phosphohistidine phosphatase
MNESERATGEELLPSKVLIIVRHGIAEDRSEEKPDNERELTAKGQKRMKEIAKRLAKLLPEPDALISSPYVRAVQTALFISKAYDGSVTVRTSDALTPGSSPEDFVSLVRSQDFRLMFVVGHEPNLTRGMCALTGMSGAGLELKKGGIYAVTIEGEEADLEWMLPPRIVRKLK